MHFITMDEVAKRLCVSKRWLQDFLKTRPFGKLAGRRRLFTEADVVAIFEELPSCRSISVPRVKEKAQTMKFAGRTSGNELSDLRELLTAGRPQKSSRASKMKSNVEPFPGQGSRHSPARP